MLINKLLFLVRDCKDIKTKKPPAILPSKTAGDFFKKCIFLSYSADTGSIDTYDRSLRLLVNVTIPSSKANKV